MMPVKLVISSSLIGVEGCVSHVKPLFGFQFLRDCSGVLQIQSQIYGCFYINALIYWLAGTAQGGKNYSLSIFGYKGWPSK